MTGVHDKSPGRRVVFGVCAALSAALLTAALVAASAAPAFARSHAIKATATSGRVFTFEFGANDPPTEWDTKIMMKWAATVARDTRHHVQIRVVPSDGLGSNATQLAAVENGSQFGYTMSEGDVEGLSPVLTVPDLPYVFSGGVSQADTLLNGGFLGAQLSKALLQHGVRPLGWITYGPRDIIAKRPVHTPAQLKGLKIRVQPSKSYESGYKRLGADINPIAYDQVYTALATGVVDAMENGPTQLAALKIYQVAHYLTLDDMLESVGAILISQKLYRELPKKYQAIVSRDGLKAARQEFNGFADANAAALKILKQNGTHIFYPNQAKWQKAIGNTAVDFARTQGRAAVKLYEKVKRIERSQS